MSKKNAPFRMRRSVFHLALGGVIAAMYAALAMVNIPISFFQLRPAEALTPLSEYLACSSDMHALYDVLFCFGILIPPP